MSFLHFPRWSQRKLLYPVAVFAVIVPTVLMALYGTWALREIETRPAGYRAELRQIQSNARSEVELMLTPLAAIKPPASAADIDKVAADSKTYIDNYTKAVALHVYVGIAGQIKSRPDQENPRPDPPQVAEFFAQNAKPVDKPTVDVIRRTINIEQRNERVCYVCYIDTHSAGIVAWELKSDTLSNAAQTVINRTQLPSKALRIDLVDLSAPEATPLGASQEPLATASIHPEIMPWMSLELRRDVATRLWADDTMLSSIFLIIAVLGVPIVAAATLYAVQMILREAAEARKKVDFVSNVTHELKTPLTSIRMFIETLKLGRVQEKSQVDACLDTILQEANRLGTLIDHVLSFSRIENQVKKYNMRPENLAHVVRDTVALFKAQMRATDGVIRMFILPGIPTAAEFDKDAIREVILNLLSNAIKYSGEDKFVTVRAGVDKDDLFIEIGDRGIGIDPADHARIFDKFYRVDEALTRKVDGTGLGLTISLEIVRAHGGRITVDSARGKGSRFTVHVPYRPGRPTAKMRDSRTSTREIVARPEPQTETPAPAVKE